MFKAIQTSDQSMTALWSQIQSERFGLPVRTARTASPNGSDCYGGRRPMSHRSVQTCTEGSEEQIELLQLDKAGIKVAQYMTELPPRGVLQYQIQKSLAIAKARLANFAEDDA